MDGKIQIAAESQTKRSVHRSLDSRGKADRLKMSEEKKRIIRSIAFRDEELHGTVKAIVGKPAPGDGREVLSIEVGGWGYLIWLKGRVDPMNVNKEEVQGAPEFEP